MRISFVVPMKNSSKYIKKCLKSIIKEMLPDDEIIVVDNGSNDNSIMIAREFGITLLNFPEGTIGAVRNYGAQHSQADIIAFIDSDCTISNGWREQVIRNLKNETIVGVGSKVSIPIKASWIERAWLSQRNLSDASPAKYINSGNFAIKRTIFEKVGGFDNKLVTGEDSELGWRLNNYGYVIIRDPSIVAIHHDNPKNIMNFYKKEKWHAIGMMGTFNISIWDKPLLMTLAFICSVVIYIIAFPWLLNRKMSIKGLLVIIGWVPCITAGYRVYQFHNIFYFPQLILLYLLYFIARSQALINIVGKTLYNRNCKG
jgi:glycosyltransferase involved in cell wall biosynthesis